MGSIRVIMVGRNSAADCFREFAERHRAASEALDEYKEDARLLRAYEGYRRRWGFLSKKEFMAVMKYPADSEELLHTAFNICFMVTTILQAGPPDDGDVIVAAKIMGALDDHPKIFDGVSLWAEARTIRGEML